MIPINPLSEHGLHEPPKSTLRDQYFHIKKADAMLHRERMKLNEALEQWLLRQEIVQNFAEEMTMFAQEECSKDPSYSSNSGRSPLASPRSNEVVLAKVWQKHKPPLDPRCECRSSLAEQSKPKLAMPIREATGDSVDPDDIRLAEGCNVVEVDGERCSDNQVTNPPEGTDGFAYVSPDALRPASPGSKPTIGASSTFDEFENPLGRARKAASQSRKKQSMVERFGSVVGSDIHEDIYRREAENLAYEDEDEKVVASTVIDKERIAVARFIGHPFTEVFIAFLILSNSILVGIEVDWNVNNPGAETVPLAYSIAGHCFNVIFAIEVGLRAFAFGSLFWLGNQKGWNIFDFALVLSSFVEVILIVVNSSASSENASSLRIVRIVRISRILRVIRVARLVRLLIALRLLLVQIMGTLRLCFWAFILFCLILYSFGMVFAQISTAYIHDNINNPEVDTTLLEKYWGSVAKSMYTLFKSVSGGLDWEIVAQPLSQIDPFWVLLFNCFLTFTLFAVLNVVVGVFCQSAIQSAAGDPENTIRIKLKEREDYMNKIKTLFAHIDTSGDGNITYHELENHLDDAKVCAYFDSLGLDPSDAWDLFKLLDADSSRVINCEEFCIGCLRLRGYAKAIDIEKVHYENRTMRKRLAAFMRYTERTLQDIQETSKNVSTSSV